MPKLWSCISAVAASAIIAGAITFPIFPDAVARNSAPLVSAAPLAAVSVDGHRGWPYTQRAQNVRLVTTDRLN